MELSILFRLLLAHFLADFLLQRRDWKRGRTVLKWRAPGTYYHAGVVGMVTFLLQWDLSKWYIPLLIMPIHAAIDVWKSCKPNTTGYFLADQALHLASIILLWIMAYMNSYSLSIFSEYLTDSPRLWLIILAYYLVTGPLGIAIGYATSRWQKEAGMDAGGLKKAGLWIGRCERVLVLTFIILQQYTALGFLMAAKSILRFGDGEERHQKKTEYILVGTLLSFASAAIIGVIVNGVLAYLSAAT